MAGEFSEAVLDRIDAAHALTRTGQNYAINMVALSGQPAKRSYVRSSKTVLHSRS
jgi:hypothetical protein